MRFLAAAVALIATAAAAEEPRTYTLTVTPDQVGILVDGLMELPAKRMMPLYQSIINQIGAQNQAKPQDTTPVEETPK